MSVREKVNYYKEDLEMFETPNEMFEYIFDLGKKHTTLPQEEKNEATFIEGCASHAWLVGECKDGKLILRGEGSSEMAKGMLSLLLDIFSGQEVDDILAFDPKELEKLGIIEHLSPVRQQSLEAFLNKVYAYAKRCKEETV
ncbi:SufE family protein [Sulfurimonas sp. SWIR-19]|uniref:SufE family protein n=1 Tax=Sulfurimonas sp. SWIR-19 TaxID=2878390 RepID=UPI001CF5A1FC|nr:SufE family protein [Sulfurimonas sp. SWIR-19]UCN00004.1 SufE family protein [Sulfurimonas sp. SWIR-19]